MIRVDRIWLATEALDMHYGADRMPAHIIEVFGRARPPSCSFSVERQIRGRRACRACEQITQAPMPAYVIDKGIPTPGLLAQVLVAKYGDHLPLYRQQGIYAREGVRLPTSTLSEWVGVCGQQLKPLVDALKAALLGRPVLQADDTPVLMLRTPRVPNPRQAAIGPPCGCMAARPSMH